MGILNFLKKAGFRAAVPVATLVASAACSGLYEENFYANDYHPELSRSDSAILADTPNVRRVFVLFSFGYNNLSYDLKEDIEDVIASGVPEYGFDENVGKEILAKIKEEYKAEERYDVMDYVDKSLLNGNQKAEDDSIADDIAVTVLLLVVVAGVVLGIFTLRKSN